MARQSANTSQLITGNALALSPPFTAAYWFKFSGTGGFATTAFQQASADNNHYHYLGILYDKLVTATRQAPTNASATATDAFSTTEWNHGAGLWVSSSSRKVRFNQKTVSNTTNLTPQNLANLTCCRTASSGITLVLAELAVWSVELTDAEIDSLVKGFKPRRIRPQNLFFYLPLIMDIADVKSGHALTNNGTTIADHPRVY